MIYRQFCLIIFGILFSISTLSCFDNDKNPLSSESFTVTGRIVYTDVGLSGVHIHVTGSGMDQTLITDDKGIYIFQGKSGNSYTIAPLFDAGTFSPFALTTTIAKKDEILQDIILAKYDSNKTVQISGKITGADSVEVKLENNENIQTVITDDRGDYVFTDVCVMKEVSIIPSKVGYKFSPNVLVFNNITSNETCNFNANYTTLKISGIISGVDTVTVTLSGDQTDSQIVNNGESFSFTVPYGGSYAITPTKKGYIFTPMSKTYMNVINSEVFNFSGEELFKSLEIDMQNVPEGSFSMGQIGVVEPVHFVTLSSFEISVSEITQYQYLAITGINPSYFRGNNNFPVESLSWSDAIKFCNKLSDAASLEMCYDEISGKCDFSKNGFRLPTEAEWEYACRSGSKATYNLGYYIGDLDKAGWYDANSGSKIHKVKDKTSNSWGIFDMHGNVWEWCNDWYGEYTSNNVENPIGEINGSKKVIRGGSFDSDRFECQSAYRTYNNPDIKSYLVGFRVVRHIHSF